MEIFLEPELRDATEQEKKEFETDQQIKNITMILKARIGILFRSLTDEEIKLSEDIQTEIRAIKTRNRISRNTQKDVITDEKVKSLNDGLKDMELIKLFSQADIILENLKIGINVSDEVLVAENLLKIDILADELAKRIKVAKKKVFIVLLSTLGAIALAALTTIVGLSIGFIKKKIHGYKVNKMSHISHTLAISHQGNPIDEKITVNTLPIIPAISDLQDRFRHNRRHNSILMQGSGNTFN